MTTECGNGEFCATLSRQIKNPGENGYGLFAVTGGRRITGPLIGVRYKKNAKSDGVMLNYCPFCGKRIDWY
jgi:hypothetical protein